MNTAVRPLPPRPPRPPVKGGFRRTLHFCRIDCRTPLGKGIDLAIAPTVALRVPPLFKFTPDLAFLKLLRGLRIFRIFRYLRFTADPDFFFGRYTWRFLRGLRLFLTIFMLFFISSGLFSRVEHSTNPMVNNFGDALCFTEVALTTVGFGEIVPVTSGGRWLAVAMILTNIVLIPWQAGLIIKAWLRMGTKRDLICTRCGLHWQDRDASHCKSCGNIIFQECEGMVETMTVGVKRFGQAPPGAASSRSQRIRTAAEPRHPPIHSASVAVLLFLISIIVGAGTTAASEARLTVGAFSGQSPGGPLPQGWEALRFDGIDRQTRYWLDAEENGVVVVRAQSEAAASGLQRRIRIDLTEWPRLQWRWRVEMPVTGEKMSSKAGDDYAARLYVNFAFMPERAGFWERQLHALGTRRYGHPPPGSALTYIWSSTARRDTAAPSPYTDKVKMLALRGREDPTGHWYSEIRDVAADYRRLFGEAPPPVIGIAIMCDTDNTGSRAAAAFGDIVFLRKAHP